MLLDINVKQTRTKFTRHSTLWGNMFQFLRWHANSLHLAIRNSWKCSCNFPHMATLSLQRRNTEDWSPTFNMVFDTIGTECLIVKHRAVTISLGQSVGRVEQNLANASNQVPASVLQHQFDLGGLRADLKAGEPSSNALWSSGLMPVCQQPTSATKRPGILRNISK